MNLNALHVKVAVEGGPILVFLVCVFVVLILTNRLKKEY